MFSWESLHSIAVGGVGVHITELAAALERKGHEVHVFTRMGQGQSHYVRIDGVHYHLSYAHNRPDSPAR
jgi:glycosyltransferase involved in cell wall biosynthesis